MLRRAILLLKVSFALFPKFWGIVLVLALAGEAAGLTNLALTFLFVTLSIFIHEVGHLVAGISVGGSPESIVFGEGKEVARTSLRKVILVANQKQRAAFALVRFQKEPTLVQRIVFCAGGIAMNLLIVCCGCVYGTVDVLFLSRAIIDWQTPFLLANGFVVVANILPFKYKFNGRSFDSDGLLLAKILFGSNVGNIRN